MVRLHAIWRGGQLHLWGEHSPSTEESTRAPLEGAGAQIHPHALTPGQLHAAVGELSPDALLASIAAEGSLTLWLPARAGRPLPSSAGDGPPVGAAVGSNRVVPVELAPFQVCTLALAPADAMDFVTSLTEPLPRVCSDSIRYWARLGRYMHVLLGRKQFVPDLEQVGDAGSRACWRVVVQDEGERSWLQRYAAAMPPVCRAEAFRVETGADDVALVESFLHVCADAVIRRALEEDPFFHQIHERAVANRSWEVRWLAALMSGDDRVSCPPEELRDQMHLLRAWIGRLDGDVAAPARLCFCLRDPDDEELTCDEGEGDAGDGDAVAFRDETQALWRVDILLESLSADGALHDVAELFVERGANPGILKRNLANRREHLLADLWRAAEVFAPLADVLQAGVPRHVQLTAAEAHAFLRDCAPLLEARGFAVHLPPWAERSQRRLGLRLHVNSVGRESAGGVVGGGGLGLASLVDFEWRVAIGDTDIALEEFQQMRTNRAPLVRLHGEWVVLDAEALDAADAFLQENRRGRMTLGQAIRTVAGVEELATGLPVVGIHGSDWIDHLLRTAGDVRVAHLAQPEAFVGTLRPYQLRGLEWMIFMQRIGVGACLADDMGLGKTIQLIAVLLAERRGDESVGPTLIFAPMTVVGNWQREIARFAPGLRVLIHHGGERLSGDAFVEAAREHDVVITTYALGHRDFANLARVSWHRLVLDEAQKIKNPAAAQTISIRALPATHRVALTGTPLENHLSELWSIMDMLNPGLLGSAARFRKRFAVPVERLGDVERAAQLRQLIHPFVLRRVKNDPDVSCDLPEKMEMQVYCNLTPEQAVLYEQIVESALGEIESAAGIRRRGVILAALTRLKQICNHPVHYLRDGSSLDGRSGKCERLNEMLEEVLAEGDAALVFTQFREMGDLLQRMLTERLHTEVLFLHGASTAKSRQMMIDRFQDPASGVRVFLLSLRAGGLGLNLTAANHVFHFDRWWNPAVESQATDRVYRIGQTRRVQVHKFVCLGTIEERIDKMLTEKLALADRIVGSGDEWLTELSTEELRVCLSLSRDAVGEVADERA